MLHSIRGDYSSMTDVTETLSAIEAQLSFAASVDIYYRYNDVFFYGTKFFCYMDQSACKLGFRERWLEQLGQAGTQVAWYPIAAADNPDREKLVSYVRNYPYFAPPDKRKAVFAVNLKESAIRGKLAQSLAPGGGLIFVVDGGGALISSNASAREEDEFRRAGIRFPQPARETDEEQPIERVKWEGKEAVAAFADSEINDWRYVTIAEKSVFYKRAAHIRNLMYALGGALLAVGLALVYMLTKRAHKPIGLTLRAYSLRIDDLNDQLAKHEPVIKYHGIMSLLTGTGLAGAGGQTADMRLFLDLHLREPYFFCFVLNMAGGMDGESRSGVAAAYRMAERLEAAGSLSCKIWAVVSPEGSIYGIVNGAEPDGEADERVLQGEVERHADEPCSLCLGGRYAIEETAPAVSHREACEAAAYAYFYPERRVVRYDALGIPSRKDGGGPAKAPDELAAALRAADEDKALRVVRSAIEEASSGLYAAAYARQLLGELDAALGKTLKSLGIGSRELYGCDIKERAAGLANVRLYADWIEEAVNLAVREIEAQRKGADTELNARVKAYVEAHLCGELSLDRIAEHIGVTPNYLSRLFKLGAGVTLIEYITGRKLEKAAELLRENGRSVGEIALLLGYQSPNHFIRIFKEKYGLTPKQFQKSGF
ncbi:AraC family transcriptional regulator [Cohnella rhizosphaerae]|uniref:AraC family transcriptional regulator n=1 Tax=Cohnella rhizosphaerae TaxID=1457232 RepID=A0A9X4QT56_9BACL|nr:AraC family transcriptional regulator [Cohnella rhizosphaerae]MDG0809968.1 AraC family transcriptional regulator [Cohnella rhizosphaerae]